MDGDVCTRCGGSGEILVFDDDLGSSLTSCRCHNGLEITHSSRGPKWTMEEVHRRCFDRIKIENPKLYKLFVEPYEDKK